MSSDTTRTARLAEAKERFRVTLQAEGYTADQIARISKYAAEFTAACVRVELTMRDAAAATRKFTETMDQLGVTIETLNRKHTHGKH